MRIAVCHVALCAAALLPVRAAWAWGAGHDTVARCVLEKLPAAWKSRFRPEWRPAFLAAAHLPDNGDARVLGPDELLWLRENGGLGASLYALHAGPPVYGEIERLVGALSEIRRRFRRADRANMMRHEYISPEVAAAPQEAFYAEKVSLPIEQTAGHICTEFVMCYPPGIPILAPGERITPEILDYIRYAKEKGCSMTGPEDMDITRLNVWKGEHR